MTRHRDILLALMLGVVMSRSAIAASPPRLTLERVARYPPPGRRIPGEFRFSFDGRALYYLAGEGRDMARLLVREEVATGRREVVARPPARPQGASEAAGREEILRRERQRIQDRGITQYVLAEKAEVAVFAYEGALYLVRPGQEPVRLTETGSTALDPQLSPDGRLLAFVRNDDLVLLDLSTRTEKRLTEGARDGLTHGVAEYIAQEEMDRFSGFWWSPDGTRIAYTEVDEGRIPLYPIVHQGGGTVEIEPHRYPFAGGPNARVRLGILPVAAGATVWADLGADDDIYLARVAWDEAGGGLWAQVESRDQKNLRLLRFDPKTGRGVTLLDDRSDAFINLHDDLRVLADGRFLWSSERSGYRHLELRGRDGALVRTLTSGVWAVDALAGVDEERGVVYFTAAKESPLERRLYSVPLEGGKIESVTGEPGWHAVTISRDGRWFVDLHDSAAAPPRILLRQTTGQTLRILDPNDDPEIAALGLVPPKIVTLKAADGTLLYGAIATPRRLEPGRRYPALIKVYGGPTDQMVHDSWEMTQDLRVQYLTDQGYVVFRLDNRGTERRGQAFQAALYHHLGSVEVEDQIAGARYLASLPYVDGTRIGIYGWSYGGYMAARCLLKAPGVFKAAVAGAPVADWDGYDTHYTERYMGRPDENPQGYRESSLLPLAPELRGALLIIHGMADENVHFRHTARFINALNAAQRRYDLLIFPDERHLPRGEEDRRYLEERLVSHFDRILKDKKPGAAPSREAAPNSSSQNR